MKHSNAIPYCYSEDYVIDDDQHNEFASLFGPLEDRLADVAGEKPRNRPPLPKVTNLAKDGNGVLEESSFKVLDLKANQLWHTDSSFLYTPALGNVISARVVPSSGGETQLVSTRAAWRAMPTPLRKRVQEAVFFHRLSHSRAQVDPLLGKQAQITQYHAQPWRAVWTNPATEEEALYIASHAFAVKGLSEKEGYELITELIEWCTQASYICSHHWKVGDVMV